MTAYPYTPKQAEQRIEEETKDINFRISDFATGFREENLPAIAIDYLINKQSLT